MVAGAASWFTSFLLSFSVYFDVKNTGLLTHFFSGTRRHRVQSATISGALLTPSTWYTLHCMARSLLMVRAASYGFTPPKWYGSNIPVRSGSLALASCVTHSRRMVHSCIMIRSCTLGESFLMTRLLFLKRSSFLARSYIVAPSTCSAHSACMARTASLIRSVSVGALFSFGSLRYIGTLHLFGSLRCSGLALHGSVAADTFFERRQLRGRDIAGQQ